MDFVKDEKYIAERISEYGRRADFPIEGELMVKITLNEYRWLVETLAETRVYNRRYLEKINELEERNEKLHEMRSNLERENEALIEENEGLNEWVHKLREEIAALKGESSNE